MLSRIKRPAGVALALIACAIGGGDDARAAEKAAPKPATSARAAKPWCAPEVKRLSDHVCYFDGDDGSRERRTLVVYLHGMLATTPGFQYLQQQAMAIHAKRLNFTVLLPTSPLTPRGYLWPTGQKARKETEEALLAGIERSRGELERRVGHRFDETFVVGFSSGAYYASSLVRRGALDVDGYIILAGGSSFAGNDAVAEERAPVFVGVSKKDRHSREDSRALAGALRSLGWPLRIEERNAGHMVDWTLLGDGIAWLRKRAEARNAEAAHGAEPEPNAARRSSVR